MEEQTIQAFPPRITFKKSSIKKNVSWEIVSSSHKDEEELNKIVEMIERVHKEMEIKFNKLKEGVSKRN